MHFLQTELDRYSRHFLISGWGSEKQLKLKNSLVIFADTEEVAARYLVSAGVGTILMMDSDSKTLNELQSINSDSRVLSFDTQLLKSINASSILVIAHADNPLNTEEIFNSYHHIAFENDKIYFYKSPSSSLQSIELNTKLDRSKVSLGIHLSLITIKALLTSSE